MTRVCIIAFDALEYNWVEEFNLEHIKQVEYGKIDVSMFSDLATPIIWASFISGLPPEQHGLDMNAVPQWRSSVIDTLRRLSTKIRLDRIKGKGRILEFLGFEHRAFYDTIVEDFRNRQIPTLFDTIPNAKALSVPPYQRWIDPQTQLLLKQAIEQADKVTMFEEHVWNVFEQTKMEYFNILQKDDWNLFMVHFMFTDLLGHIYAGNPTKMFGAYMKADQLVADTNKILGEKTLLLVVSDHGMQAMGKGMYGEHSNHGFYSSNHKLNLETPKITDFFNLVVETSNT